MKGYPAVLLPEEKITSQNQKSCVLLTTGINIQQFIPKTQGFFRFDGFVTFPMVSLQADSPFSIMTPERGITHFLLTNRASLLMYGFCADRPAYPSAAYNR